MRSTSSSTRWYSCALSMRIAWKSSVSRSRSSLPTRLCSRIDDRRRARRFHPLADLGPDGVERLEVADDVFLGPAGRGGADDDAAGEAVRLAELADDAAQPRALLARLDLARHADVIDRRHEHQEPARHRHVRGEAGALGAERLLDDLDEDLLPFLQQVLDLRLRPSRLALAGCRCRPPSAFARRPRRPRRRLRACRTPRACRSTSAT